ncbi:MULTISPECIES: LysR substrate-binding domain-containing protein [unclassified Sphingomonas]|jgi:LysR family glycine cleavage system transcriptional activator|uniref:LysR substrate-binding domain-containing protein n=1 Tax=unclassified Sphingomonas TaxID=196159 RepID=UPI000831CB01|nr:MULTISPECIES: LysR substrate-binding domain-containing protein [unclassified Sphingomonas]MCH4893585.1 LysR family transcriptional regulator [Sphingomonas sp. SFZ2018-12]
MRRLPPLTAIEAFVHVARLGSLKAAASELALSSPALSRRVQALERFVGKALFERRHQAMVLNADGERLLAQIAPALDTLADAVEAMSTGGDVLRLRLAVLPLFASQRLMPRLGDLRRQHPRLHLDVDTTSNALARLGDGIDAAIVLAPAVDPQFHSVRLDRNRVYAIGARALVEGDAPVRHPAQMAGLTALVHRDMPNTFAEWRVAMGVPDLEPLAIDHFDSGALMLEAAALGIGVAFMLESHFEGARDDRLVRLFDAAVDSAYSYWFVCRRRALDQQPVRLFHDWLVATVATTAE